MATDHKDPRKLNLDAPLLSTRRPIGLNTGTHKKSRAASWDSRNRVPFSWELSAGKPKVDAGVTQIPDDFPVPPPRPPPGRKLVENDQYDGDDDFSDAIDTFSLSAAIDMVESAEMAKLSGNLLSGHVSLEPCGNESPSFIIQRFLSDAKALAISSGLPIAKNISNQQEKCKSQMIHTSPKGCGLGVGLDALFPWRTKHRRAPCGVKSPVRVTAASVKSQWGFKPKTK